MTVFGKRAVPDELEVWVWFKQSIYYGRFMRELQNLVCSLMPDSCTEVSVGDEDPDEIVVDTSEADWMAKALTADRPPPFSLPWEPGDEGANPMMMRFMDGYCHERNGAWRVFLNSGDGLFDWDRNGWALKNQLSIYFGASYGGDERGARIATRCLQAIVECWGPVFACACMAQEYDAKNVVKGANVRRMPCGREFSRHLPGVYWATYFGSDCADFFGHDRLMSSPAPRVESAGNGAIIFLAKGPSHWRRDRYRQTEKRVREHLGVEHFWDLRHPHRQTQGLDLGFPAAPLRADLPGVSRIQPVGRVPRVLLRRCLFSVFAAACGIIATFLMLLTPDNAFVAGPVAALGLLLGVIGCIRFLLNRETYVGPALVGLGLSTLALGPCVLLFLV
ncbi:MAG: hypothetical protein GX591_17325 [Planctomycetes bacterium]|nr:hypothetical protein [Planctomycetota bacterium]